MATNFKRLRDGINLGSLSSDPAGAAAGDFYFNTALNKFRGFDGTSWENLATEDYVDASIAAIDFPVDSVNGQTGTVVLDADDVSAANQTLSNLTGPTSVNQSLVPNTDATRSLGAPTSKWGPSYITQLRDGSNNTIINVESQLLLDASNNQAFEWGGSENISRKDLNMDNNTVFGLPTPLTDSEATNKLYVDTEISTNAANRTLSNLNSPTSINRDLLPFGNVQLGDSTRRWRGLNISGGTGITNTGINLGEDTKLIARNGVDFNLSSTNPLKIASTENTLGSSPNVTIVTGDSTINSGNIILTTGSPISGTKGHVSIQGQYLDVNNTNITNLADPLSDQDAVTRKYVDTNTILISEKGSPNGVATLDATGKIPVSQLPSAVMTYEGVWNATTNAPTLADGVGDAGMVYRVGTAGTQDLGSGPITFDVGDYVIYNGTIWEKSDTTDAVASVNGFTGIVTLDTDDVPEGTTNLYYTDARVLAALPQDIATTATPQFQDVQVIGTGLGNRLVGKTLALASSTGVISGFTLSINGGDASKFDIAAGVGEIVDVTNPSAPVVIPVNFAGQTAVTVTDLLTAPVTYVSVDSSGNIYQQTTVPTPVERRQRMFIGRLNHSNNTTITFANTYPDFKLSFISQYYDLLDALAPFKIGGLSISANGANLSFNRSSGSAFFRSNNYTTNPSNPHTSTFTASTQQSFRKFTQTTTVDAVNVNVIDPANYDVNGVVTPIPGGGGTSTIQRIYLFKSGEVRVAYGQNTYGNLADALAAINTDSFIPNTTIDQSAILVGYIVVRKDATNLSNTAQARILTAARFDAGGSAVAGGITSLQQAYNNSTLPQIILSSALGAFTVDDNATPLGTDLFQVRNNAGTDHFAVSALNTKVSNTLQIPTGAGTGKVLTSDASGNASWQDAASTLQDVYDNSTPPTINLTPSGPVEIFDPGVAGGRAFSVTTTGGAFEVRDSELSYTGPNVLLNDTSIKGVKNPIEWDNATNRDYVDNRSNTNFILNGTSESGTDGWSTYADAAGTRPVDGTGGTANVTFTTSSSSPLSGSNSFLLTKDAVNRQGQGASYDFTIDSASKASMLVIDFDYEVASGTFAAGSTTTDSDVMVYLYDVTNNKLIEPQGGSKLFSSKGSYKAWFQTAPDSVNYRLILHVASTSAVAYSLRLDNVSVSRSNYAVGTIITDWKSFAPASSWGGSVNWYTGRYRQVGDSAEIRYYGVLTGTPTGNLYPTLPTGLVIDTSKLPAASMTNVDSFGTAIMVDVSTGTNYIADVAGQSTTSFRLRTHGTSTGAVDAASPFAWVSSDIVSITASVPILGWSAGAQMSDGYDGRVIAASYTTTATTAISISGTVITYGTKNFDTTNSMSGNTYTIPSSGWYRLTGSIRLTDRTWTTGGLWLFGKVNGSVNTPYIAEWQQATGSVATGSMVAKGSILYEFKAGDTIQFYGSQTETTSVNLNGSSFSNFVMIEKLSGSAFMSPTATVAMRAVSSSGQSFPYGTSTVPVQYSTVSYDYTGMWNTSTNSATITETGLYEITYYASVRNTAATTTSIPSSHYLQKNGVDILNWVDSDPLYTAKSPTGAAEFKELLRSTTLQLVAGDVIRMRALYYGTSSAGNVTVNATTNGYIEIKKVK